MDDGYALAQAVSRRPIEAENRVLSLIISCRTCNEHNGMRRTCLRVIRFSLVRITGARGGALGWRTALQTGRPRVRFPRGSLGLFLDLILTTAYGCGIDSISNRNEYHGYLVGGGGGVKTTGV
jgi:hypothetical protein